MREIVTIQVGDYANFIGSHFWNFQDELLGLADDPNADRVFRNTFLDADVLYRAGKTRQGYLTYCPRLVSIGSQGSLGCLSLSGSFRRSLPSDSPADILTWTGKVTRSSAKPLEQNLFLRSLSEEGCEELTPVTRPNSTGANHQTITDKDRVESLEQGAKFWTDYSKVQYHHRSLYELAGSWTDFESFDNYGIGKAVVSERGHMEEMEERLRFFFEECDHIQGIQFVIDDSGGFSAVAANYLEHIADEYKSTPVLLYSVRDPLSYACASTQKESMIRALHDAVSLSKLSSFCHLMVPIGLPSLTTSKLSSLLCVNDEKYFHSSAVYAASLHAISIPLRVEPLGPTSNSVLSAVHLDVGGLIHTLSDQVRNNIVAVLDLAMPAPTLSGERGSIIESLQQLTPELADDADDMYAAEVLAVHGAFDLGSNRASIARVKEHISTAYESSSRSRTLKHLAALTCPLPVPLPFPSIFRSQVGEHGQIFDSDRLEGSNHNLAKGPLEIDSVPVAARLRSSHAIVPFIKSRSANLIRYGASRGARGAMVLQDWGFAADEIRDMSEHLSKMVQSFYPDLEFSSDSELE